MDHDADFDAASQVSQIEENDDLEPFDFFKFDTPAVLASEGVITHTADDEDKDDLGSLQDFNFDAPADIASEGFDSLAAAIERSRQPENIRELGISINKRRAAKQGARGAATAWIDQDDSGTYDPKRKRATPSECGSRKVKRRRVPKEFDEDGNPKPRNNYHPVGYSFSLKLKFSFKTKRALDYLRSISPGPFDSEPSSSDESSDSSIDSDSGYGSFSKPRRKKKQPDRLVESSRADGLTVDDLTSGHPQRRGCKACFEAGDDECTIIEHEFEYPCEACRDASVDCELIIPPELKKSCERCKKKRLRCSYCDDGGRRVDSCDACEEEGVICCAAPLKDSSYSRRYDTALTRPTRTQKPSAPVSEAPSQERTYVSCNQCRETGGRCSLKGKQSTGPCSGCRKNNEECKFVFQGARQKLVEISEAESAGRNERNGRNQYKNKSSRKSRTRTPSPPPRHPRMRNPYITPKRHSQTLLTEVAYIGEKLGKRSLKKKLTGKSAAYAIDLQSRSTSGEELERIGYTKGYRHVFITTSFCHPIVFNYEPDPMGRKPCSWCNSSFFGLYGCTDSNGPRKVEGYYDLETGGFEEVDGGWCHEKPQTKMCVQCTYDRVRILMCSFHRLRPLLATEQDPNIWDNNKWFSACDAAGKEDVVGGALFLNAKWCSLCPTLATFKCASDQVYNRNGDEAGDEGCGLVLCDACMELMDKCISSYGNECTGREALDAVVPEARRNKIKYPVGLRADAEFLTTDGEMYKRVMQTDVADNEAEEDEVSLVPVLETRDRKGKGKDWGMFEPRFRRACTPPGLESRSVEEVEDFVLSGPGDEWMIEGKGGRAMEDVKVKGDDARGGIGGPQRKNVHFSSAIDGAGSGGVAKGKEKEKMITVIALSDDED